MLRRKNVKYADESVNNQHHWLGSRAWTLLLDVRRQSLLVYVPPAPE